MSGAGAGAGSQRRTIIKLVFSYKTQDETGGKRYKTVAGIVVGMVGKIADLLETVYGHEVYYELRDITAGPMCARPAATEPRRTARVTVPEPAGRAGAPAAGPAC